MTTFRLAFSEDYRGNHWYQFKRETDAEDEGVASGTARDDDASSDDSDGDRFDDEHDCGSFTVPVLPDGVDPATLRLFVVVSNDEYMFDVVRFVTQWSGGKVINMLHQLHSHINGCLPFKCTGMGAGYKEEGEYPDPIPVTNPDIAALDVPAWGFLGKPTVAIVVDSSNRIAHHMSIRPFE